MSIGVSVSSSGTPVTFRDVRVWTPSKKRWIILPACTACGCFVATGEAALTDAHIASCKGKGP